LNLKEQIIGTPDGQKGCQQYGKSIGQMFK
jgi:hypothetical protein